MATNTHSEYVVLFHGSNGHTNAPQCYIIGTLPVFLLCGEYLAKNLRVILTLDPVNKGNSVLRNADHFSFKDTALHRIRR